MNHKLLVIVNDPSPIHPNTMLELIETVMVAEGGEQSPWIPGATAKSLLVKLRATLKQERSLGHCRQLGPAPQMRIALPTDEQITTAIDGR